MTAAASSVPAPSGDAVARAAFWLPVWTLCRRELIRFWREKTRVLGFVASPLIFWVVIGSGYGDLGFFFPGALTLTVMFSAIFDDERH